VKVLVVEDDVKIAAAIESGLRQEGLEASAAHTGEDGFFKISEDRYDVVILDWGLPGRSGIDVLKTLRKMGDDTKVLILTARDGIEDRVLGLDSGADDYLVKPFAFPELLARVRALGRRARPEEATKFTCADLELDLVTRAVVRGATSIELTVREFDLLAYLLKHKGHIVSREMIAKDVWHEPGRVTPLDNVIDVHVTRLRRKIDEPFQTKLLRTVRGVGFVLE
jgi:two-component system, OmpR family, copper resistance phosphate regulon response regulator CusR